MRPKDLNKEAAIREKAIEMIVGEGFDGLSMQKLAKAANVSPATIYLYFKNREDLLHQLYMQVEEQFSTAILRNFDPEMPFEEGLWTQWKNRYQHIVAHPLYYHFSEQFRNSPLIRHDAIRETPFRKVMHQFLKNAVRKGEVLELPVEIFWSMAYGPFYILVKFHLEQAGLARKPFALGEQKLKQAFRLVMRALAP